MNRSFLIILLSVGLLGAAGCQSPTQSPTAQSQQPPQPQAQSPATEETSEQDSPPETASTTGASQSSDTSEPSEMSEANPDQVVLQARHRLPRVAPSAQMKKLRFLINSWMPPWPNLTI